MKNLKERHRTDAVVVHLRNYGDSHRIVELLTETHGRVSALARGARASKRRFRGALDLFVHLKVELIEGRDLWTLHAADIVDARVGMRTSLARIERASVLCECVRALVAEHSEAAATYRVFQDALDALAQGDFSGAAVGLVHIIDAAGILDARAQIEVPETDEAAAELERRLVAYVERHLGRPLRSRGVLAS